MSNRTKGYLYADAGAQAVIGSGADKQQASFASATAAPKFTYHRGSIIRNAQIYTLFIGDWSSPANTQRKDRLTQFNKDLVSSDWYSTLNEYGFKSAKFVSELTIPATVDQLTGASLATLLQNQISSGLIPEPIKAADTNSIYVIYLDDKMDIVDESIGIAMCEPKSDTAFAYHHGFTTRAGNKFYFAVIPSESDECVNYSCASKTSCSLSLSQSQEQRQTQVTSHEIAETITNPDGTGWFDTGSGDEVGDTCNGRATTITVGVNTWTVQKIFSQIENAATNGDTTCVSSSNVTIEDSNATTIGSSIALFFAENETVIAQVSVAIGLLAIAGLIYSKYKKTEAK